MHITSVALVIIAACSRSSGHSYKVYDYMKDFPAGHILTAQDLSAETLETDSTEDMFPAKAKKIFLRDAITEKQLQELLERPLIHAVRGGTKRQPCDVQ